MEHPPEYPGGKEALYEYTRSALKYPELAPANHISGTVKVKFMVDRTGKVDSIQIVNSVHSLLDKAARNVMAGIPRWNLGYIRKKDRKIWLNVGYQIPVTMTLDQPDTLLQERYDRFPQPNSELGEWQQVSAGETATGNALNPVLIYIDGFGYMTGFETVSKVTATWDNTIRQRIKSTNTLYQPPWKSATKNNMPVASEFRLQFRSIPNH